MKKMGELTWGRPHFVTRSFLDLLTPESKRTGVRLARHSPRMWIRQWLDGLFHGKSHERIDDLDHTFFFHMLKPTGRWSIFSRIFLCSMFDDYILFLTCWMLCSLCSIIFKSFFLVLVQSLFRVVKRHCRSHCRSKARFFLVTGATRFGEARTGLDRGTSRVAWHRSQPIGGTPIFLIRAGWFFIV